MYKDRIIAKIDLKKLDKNLSVIKSRINPDCRIMAIVKANAYGHGAVKISEFLQERNVDLFGVATFEEALALRKGGIYGDILVLGISPVQNARLCAAHNIMMTVASYENAKAYAEYSKKEICVHIKVDTGMTRLGIYCHSEEKIMDAADEIERIASVKNLKIGGIFTHFSRADAENPDFTKKQFSIFSALLAELERRNINVGTRHCANTSGTINYPEMQLDCIRTGIALFGLYSSQYVENIGIEPIMSLHSNIIHIADIKAGDSISYSGAFVAERDMRIATVAAGYGDGYSRLLSNKDHLLINGKKARVVGNICMDMCMADVTDIEACVGDEAIIFGEGKSADALAEIMGTVNYEVLCNVSERVRRVYIN